MSVGGIVTFSGATMFMRARLVLVAVLTVLAMLVVTYLCTDSFNNPLNSGVRTLGVAFLIVAGTAAVANIYIIYFHAVQPPHPKFLLTWDHRLAIRAHAIAGATETVLGIVAWATQSSALAVATGLVALVQIAAAYYQSPGVFGMKGVTVPLYYAAISVHLYCAVNLIATGDVAWLERTWIVLQTYAYVRIVYFLLGRTHAFRGSAYTVSVILGGAATLPFVLGPVAPYVIVGIVVLYLALFHVIMRPTTGEWSALFVEHVRRSLVPQLQGAWDRLGVEFPDGLSPREEAEIAFRRLDVDGSGALDLEEIESLLAAMGASARLQDSFRHHHHRGEDTAISFDTFLTTLWLPSHVAGTTRLQRDPGLTERQRARMVFDHLDIGRTGSIDEFEIEILLLEWGMELHEAQRTVRKLSGPEHMSYSFDEFHDRLKPIWRYGYESMTMDAE